MLSYAPQINLEIVTILLFVLPVKAPHHTGRQGTYRGCNCLGGRTFHVCGWKSSKQTRVAFSSIGTAILAAAIFNGRRSFIVSTLRYQERGIHLKVKKSMWFHGLLKSQTHKTLSYKEKALHIQTAQRYNVIWVITVCCVWARKKSKVYFSNFSKL